MNRRAWLAAVTAILLLAAALRLWRLAELPPGLHHDEAFHLLRAQEIARGETFPIYIPANQGNEPGYAYLSAITLSLLGPVSWAGRLAAAWVGIVTVALTLRAGREFFPGTAAGLWAGLALAGLYWNVAMSRWGSQPILSAAAAAGTMAALWRGARTGSAWAFVLAGVSLSLGLWSYVAFRLFPAVPVAAGALLLAAQPEQRARLVRGGLLALAVAVVLVVPLAWWFAQNPEWFFNRFRQISEVPASGSPLASWIEQTGTVLAGLVVPGAGDHDWRHNLSGRPGLDWAQAALVVVGAAALVRRWRQPQGWTLLAWLAVGLAPSILTEHPPQFGRTVMATPALALLMGAGAAWAWHQARRRLALRLALIAALALSLVVTVRDYFVRWANDGNLFIAFDAGLQWLAAQLANEPAGTALYASPVYRDYPTLEFGLGSEAYDRFRTFNGRACLVLPASTRLPAAFGVIVAEDPHTLPALQAAYPAGRVTAEQQRGEAPYAVVYTVPGGEQAQFSPGTARVVDYGGVVALAGFSLERAELEAGTQLRLTAFWQVAAATAADLRTFVHVLGPPKADGGILYAQRDAAPCDNSYPTWQWVPGEIVIDRYVLDIPAETPEGQYSLNIGWYDSGTLARLPAAGAAGEALGDSVPLAILNVVEAASR